MNAATVARTAENAIERTVAEWHVHTYTDAVTRTEPEVCQECTWEVLLSHTK